MALFSILHVSDSHIGDLPNQSNLWSWMRDRQRQLGDFPQAARRAFRQSTYDREILTKLAAAAVRDRSDFDLLVFSGDISCTGVRADLFEAREFLTGLPVDRIPHVTRSGKPTISAFGPKLMLLPGNHDRYVDHRGAPNSQEFDDVFAQWWPEGPIHRRIIRRGDEILALIAVDFCLESEDDATPPVLANRFGQGKAYRHRLERLEQETAAVRQRWNGAGVLWVVHFPPYCELCGGDESLRLIDEQLLIDSAERHGISLILSGHVHVAHDVTMGDVRISTAGSCAAYSDGLANSYDRLEIEVIGRKVELVEKASFIWSDDEVDFARPHPDPAAHPVPR